MPQCLTWSQGQHILGTRNTVVNEADKRVVLVELPCEGGKTGSKHTEKPGQNDFGWLYML